MFGSVQALCEAIALSPYGTHYRGYTINDQAAACFLVSEAGGASVNALPAVLATLGGLAVVAHLAWQKAIEADTGEPPPPGPPPGTDPGTASPPEVPDPLPAIVPG